MYPISWSQQRAASISHYNNNNSLSLTSNIGWNPLQQQQPLYPSSSSSWSQSTDCDSLYRQAPSSYQNSYKEYEDDDDYGDEKKAMEAVTRTNKQSRKLKETETKQQDTSTFQLPTGATYTLPASSGYQEDEQRSRRRKIEPWNGQLPYDESKLCCFFFKHLVKWGMINQPTGHNGKRVAFDERNIILEKECIKHHPEFRVCAEKSHARLWEFYPCVGVDVWEFPDKEECGICPRNPKLNDIFLNKAKELFNSVRSTKEAQIKFRDAYEKFWKLKDSVYKIESSQKTKLSMTEVAISMARKDMQQAFFIYNAWMWEEGERVRSGSGKEESDSVDRRLFEEFIQDFFEYRERNGPYMYCEKHRCVGDAIPWLERSQYKSCLIWDSQSKYAFDGSS